MLAYEFDRHRLLRALFRLRNETRLCVTAKFPGYILHSGAPGFSRERRGSLSKADTVFYTTTTPHPPKSRSFAADRVVHHRHVVHAQKQRRPKDPRPTTMGAAPHGRRRLIIIFYNIRPLCLRHGQSRDGATMAAAAEAGGHSHDDYPPCLLSPPTPPHREVYIHMWPRIMDGPVKARINTRTHTTPKKAQKDSQKPSARAIDNNEVVFNATYTHATNDNYTLIVIIRCRRWARARIDGSENEMPSFRVLYARESARFPRETDAIYQSTTAAFLKVWVAATRWWAAKNVLNYIDSKQFT